MRTRIRQPKRGNKNATSTQRRLLGIDSADRDAARYVRERLGGAPRITAAAFGALAHGLLRGKHHLRQV